MGRTALWEILLKIGCPTDFVTIIRSFHEGMRASVIENGEVSPDFEVTNGTKHKARLWLGSLAVRHFLFYDAVSGLPGLQLRYPDLLPYRRRCVRSEATDYKQRRKSRLPSYVTSSLPMTVRS